ncbi:CheR family methyltransferase [Pseudoduganella violacea]|uniref:Chemotaxis protein methyltransferase WspC n=1 Tax=Pseudoduganella violacea TaxID=1715466 RepID=A0A7W5FWQ6_9BURK|nr:protein-glutamate O-methyltransferase CheR [Pseudoduganella violacea]MBB3122062.1 chemotaxis protein methyltransferase WspC [Pseudoduganella violacea]
MKATELLRQATGMNLSRAVVDEAVQQRMALTGCRDRKAYLRDIAPEELTALVELVVVPESWLFRDPQAFVAAVQHVQLRAADSARMGRPVRILSLPCAGGEEPYSMAMALADAKLAPSAYSIDACDLSPACIARAQRGVYGRNAFRNSDLSFRERYFTPLGGERYQIKAEIQHQVRFRQANLLTLDATRWQGCYDVIFCRNLLIYFDKPTTRAAIGRIATMLADNGILLSGYAELPNFVHNGFTPLPHRQAFALRKDDSSPAAAGGKPAWFPERRQAPPCDGAAIPARGTPTRRSSDVARLMRQSLAPVAPLPAAPALRPPAPMPRATRAQPVAAATAVATAAPPPTPAAADALAEARRLADQGRVDDAAAACRRWLEYAPDSAEAYFILGLLSEIGRQPEQAEALLKRCLYLQPDHYEALCHLALLTEQGGDPSAAATLKARAARVYQRQLPR